MFVSLSRRRSRVQIPSGPQKGNKGYKIMEKPSEPQQLGHEYFAEAYGELYENISKQKEHEGKDFEAGPNKASAKIERQLRLGSRVLQHLFVCDRSTFLASVGQIREKLSEVHGPEHV